MNFRFVRAGTALLLLLTACLLGLLLLLGLGAIPPLVVPLVQPVVTEVRGASVGLQA